MLLHATNLSKTIAGRILFENVSVRIGAKDKIGLIGPNGAGKSTLLKMLAGLIESDSGDISTAKYSRIVYLAQTEDFSPHDTCEDVVISALAAEAGMDLHEKTTRAAIHLGKMGFDTPHTLVKDLSGGWRKRLAIAAALARQPDLLLLDEPTNHLDLEGIEWLENFLKNARFAYVVISHDRTFLEGAVSSVIEINDCFPEGAFRADGNYSYFLTHREAFLSAQISQLESTASKARREDAWLKQGIRARGTRQKARTDNADELFDELNSLKQRTIAPKALKIEFQKTERKTKRLISGHNLCKSFGERSIVNGLDITLGPGTRIGLIGYNGSGKSTLIKLLGGLIEPDQGTLTIAPGINVEMFDQNRQLVDKSQRLRDALTPSGGDAVIYQNKEVHVASWAKQLKFRSDQLETPVAALSGGEQARILLGQLMLSHADVLLLDEPTNDLDIPSLEVLEESLTAFPGAVVLVTHDRAMLDRVSTLLLGIDGQGGITPYASVEQWQRAQKGEEIEEKKKAAPIKEDGPKALAKKRKLSYKEQREWDTMEEAILSAETTLEELQNKAPTSENGDDVTAYYEALGQAQQKVEELYSRWGELEAILAGDNE